ncbi:MAG: hypothetical protein PSV16_09620 [Flavobacterium sp.]|nr:hypothetical protein [Flavobacterium sp.]
MKKLLPIIAASVMLVFFAACSSSDDGPTENVTFAVPVVKSLATIRSGVKVTAARQTASEGKIYVTQNNLFYIAKEEGVHIFNNTNPSSPQNIAFLEIEGVHDIAVKGNYLYADNFIDLLVFDISNLSNITLVKTIENVIGFNAAYPVDAQYYDYEVGPGPDEIVIGYRTEMRAVPTGGIMAYDEATGALSNGAEALPGAPSVGTGGSYARFQINQNALYTIDSWKLNVFNIVNPTTAFFDKSVYMEMWFGGGAFETLFRQGDYLFAGATSGMFIIDATDEFNPAFISGFSHATACDPVVVNGTTAYITVRGGSSCGAIEDQVNVLDISDINNPTLLSTYLMNGPRGLGVKGNTVYICGDNGLNIFDASNPSGLSLENAYVDDVTDVIPLESHLITVGPNKITQYAYGENYTLNVLSVLNF